MVIREFESLVLLWTGLTLCVNSEPGARLLAHTAKRDGACHACMVKRYLSWQEMRGANHAFGERRINEQLLLRVCAGHARKGATPAASLRWIRKAKSHTLGRKCVVLTRHLAKVASTSNSCCESAGLCKEGSNSCCQSAP